MLLVLMGVLDSSTWGNYTCIILRNLGHSTVLYETENNIPLLKLAWNRNDPHYVAVIEMDL